MHSYNNKKSAIDKHMSALKELESDTAARLEEIDKINAESKVSQHLMHNKMLCCALL